MAAQLGKVDGLYDYEKKKVNQAVIDKSLEKLRGRYSEEFVDDLGVLLNSDETKRPNFIELDDDIKFYRADVRAKAVSLRSFHLS